MKRVYKITAWVVGGILLLAACIIGWIVLKEVLDEGFEETKIYPGESRAAPADTVINVNGIPLKMIGVKGGKIDCRGLKKSIDLDDFYISETEVTQGLWSAIMGDNPSVCQGDSLPVENVDLLECLEFVSRLDSVSGHKFYIPTYPEWLYAAHIGNKVKEGNDWDSIAWHNGNSDNITHAVKQKRPDILGVYDMFGNVAEWTISGSDPLFIVAGGSFEDEKEGLNPDHREFDHAMVKAGTLGLRLLSYPADSKHY